MLRILIDTSVWLDLAKDFRKQPVLTAIEDLIAAGAIELIVPQIVIDEFARNKDKIVEQSKVSLGSHFRMVRDAVNRFGTGADKQAVLDQLNEIDHEVAMKGDAVNPAIEQIEKLLNTVGGAEPSDSAKIKAAMRALAKQAPFHRNGNSMADALLLEIYDELRQAEKDPEVSYAFVTLNHRDFSEHNGDNRKPHADLVALFGDGSEYSVDIVAVIRSQDEEMLAEYEWEHSQIIYQPRRLSEIMDAEQLLFRQVWYNRHWNLRTEIEEGTHKVVSEKDYHRNPYRNDETLDTVWKQALAAAKKTEEEVGEENLGPWDDFEWGMLNGKLSALRWIMGDEWDMLDT